MQGKRLLAGAQFRDADRCIGSIATNEPVSRKIAHQTQLAIRQLDRACTSLRSGRSALLQARLMTRCTHVCMYSNRLLSGLPVPVTASPTALPLAECPVRAGFPSQAEDFGSERLDLLGIMVEHPHTTKQCQVGAAS